jgi:hypothetical protein
MTRARHDDPASVAQEHPDADDGQDRTDEMGRESFPSSDPPAGWAGEDQEDLAAEAP